MENRESNNKKYLYIVGSLILVIALLGVTYAWFSYRGETSEQEIIAGDIYLTLNEGQDEIELTNIFPESSEEARARNDNFMTFEITGKNTSNKTIYYEFILDHGTDKASPKTRYNDADLRFDLVALDSNGDEQTYLLSDESFDSLVNKRIYVDTIDASTSSEISRKYKLRMWLDENVIISDSEQNANYTTDEFKNSYATIKLTVAGDFEEKENKKQLYQLIESLSSTKSYIANYDDIINNPSNVGFTTQDQVSTSAPKQTVYYYTGSNAAANANVLFAGYCWQIVRTTDNGGVRMIYNGVPQKDVVLTTETISNTDITYTNDTTYPYTYDGNTKKWTSTNHDDDTTGTFIFTVKNDGEYIINYDVSSEIYYDTAFFYKNNNQIEEASGEKESSVKLGIITTTDEIKIEYTKDSGTADGNDNIVFDIVKVTSRVESEDKVCQPNRMATKGINGQYATTQSMSVATLYGKSYDYDLDTGEFAIEDSAGLPSSWTTSDNNSNGIEDYKELIGTYTCLSSSTTCSTLYYVGSINQDNTAQAYVAKYTIGDVELFSQMGTSAFNANEKSPALVGYMFNKEYDYKLGSKSGEYYTNAVWENGAYTLSSGNSGTAPDAAHHYICDDNDCVKVRYYYIVNNNDYYYILLENGETIEDALYKMIGYGDVGTLSKPINSNYKLNNYNSAAKGYLENWYKKNLTAYTNYLDQTSVYCNDRSVGDLGGWNPNGTNINDYLEFIQHYGGRDLNCVNETDRFSVSNSKAKLTYSIGLLSRSEEQLMTFEYVQSGYVLSPNYFSNTNAFIHLFRGSSAVSYRGNTIRGAVTLKPGTQIESGSGTYDDPYIVGPIVTRTD